VNRYVRRDGTLVDVLWSVTWSAKDRIMFCVAHDVTDRARIEKALREAKEEADRANHAKSDFLSRMSHELRTPLNSILGFGQLLDRQSPTETQRPRVRYILSAGRHLLNLINEVLDISRIEAGTLQLSVEPVCLEEAIGEALDLMRPLAAERTITLAANCSLDTASYVLADRQRLKQVLLNLLSNAVKYTAVQGSVTVSFAGSDHDLTRISVRDTGAGIPVEKLARLFTPFDRLGAEQSAVEGTGLGLALCQRLVHAMRGSIGVNSTLGNGSTFWLDLPQSKSPLQALADTRSGSPSEAQIDEESRRVLYIEDNFSNVTLVDQMLAERPALELMTAMQGRVGLELARQHAPDLILLDLHLPDMPGWQVLAQLKADHLTREIPVVVISADATAPQIKRLLSSGARAYLTKPLDIGEFFRVIDEALSLAEAAA
jgi:signal transduction histidine kinase/CheY-like chemotaxis protein